MISVVFEGISEVDEISGHDNEHFLIGFVEELSILDWKFFIDFELIQVSLHFFLELQIPRDLNVLLSFNWKSVKINKSGVLSIDVLSTVHF